MSDIDDVLERLVTDRGFRDALADDPATALAGYSLDEGDLEVLAATLDEGGADEHGVEQRTSKSALLGLIVGLSGGGNGIWTDHNDHDPGVRRGSDGTPGDVHPDLAQQPTTPDAASRSGSPPSDELATPPDGGDGSMTKSELTGQMARRESEELHTGSEALGSEPAADEPAADADPNKPPFDVIELVGHTITDDEPDPAGRVKVQFPSDASTEDPDVRSLPEDDRPGDLRIPEEDVEPALNAFGTLTANGTGVSSDVVDGDEDLEAPEAQEGSPRD